MIADTCGFKHQDLTQKIIGVFYEVYNELGHGFLESVYDKRWSSLMSDPRLSALMRGCYEAGVQSPRSLSPHTRWRTAWQGRLKSRNTTDLG